MASERKTTRKTLSPDESEGSSGDSDEPRAKVTKLWDCNEMMMEQIPIRANEDLTDVNFVELFRANWREGNAFTYSACNTTLYSDPFKICTVQNFLADCGVIKELINEMLGVKWTRKVMDLYEFYQSTDLSNITSPYLSEFLELLKTNIMPWVEELCSVKLTSVSASCSMYNCGDYLLVHDDLLSDRQIAFVFYLSPWDNVNAWSDEMGGCLELFSADSNGLPQFPVVKRINPKNNQFVFFKVGSRSFHQVGEVTNFDYPRLTINGWFHGENNNDISTNRFSVPKIFISPLPNGVLLSDWIRDTYLEKDTKQDIQRVMEEKSEICLDSFFLQSVYESVTEELKSNESFRWTLKGPANSQCYEILELDSAEGLCKDFFTLFSSREMFKLLHEYTDLDFYGINAKDPMCCLEIQRWNHGSYTILGSTSPCERNVLDVILYLNPAEHVGEFTYVALERMEEDEEYDSDFDSVLLTVSPKRNALNIVYLSEGASKFTKYVSKKTKIINGYVYILVCSYKE